MHKEKLYMDPELTLDGLAKEMLISRGLLSQLLNDYIGDNFCDYVNKFRVEEIK